MSNQTSTQIKICSVPDRKNPSNLVEIRRYIIDNTLKPTPIIFGKFDPWTGPRGHGRLLEAVKQKFDNYHNDILIVSPSKEKKKDLFSGEQKKHIIELATSITPITIKNGLPIRILTELISMGIERPVFVVGEDRRSEYFIEYERNNKRIENINEPSFGKGEQVVIDRSNQCTSATKVRQSILCNNKDLFCSLTGYDVKMFYLMREYVNGW